MQYAVNDTPCCADAAFNLGDRCRFAIGIQSVARKSLGLSGVFARGACDGDNEVRNIVFITGGSPPTQMRVGSAKHAWIAENSRVVGPDCLASRALARGRFASWVSVSGGGG